MPARTVVFEAINKFDGVEKRNLAPSEYTQMAGRAGRRGHDPSGTVIIMANDRLPNDREIINMMLGKFLIKIKLYYFLKNLIIFIFNYINFVIYFR